MRAIACALILTTLASCAGALPEKTDTLRDFCLVYEPVYTSPADSEETRRQVDRNNAAWIELGCARNTSATPSQHNSSGPANPPLTTGSIRCGVPTVCPYQPTKETR